MRSSLYLVLGALLSSAGCGNDDDGLTFTPPDAIPPDSPLCAEPPPAEPNCARVGEVVQLRKFPHPGRGSEVAVRLLDSCGSGALPAAYASCVGVPTGASVAERQLEPGYLTVVAAVPTNDDEASRMKTALDGLLASRPEGERISLVRWGNTVDQVSDFTLDRARLAELAAADLGPASEGERAPLPETLAAARESVEEVAGRASLVTRGVVVIAPGDAPAEAAVPGKSEVAWLKLDGDVADSLSKATSRLDATFGAGAVSIGTCGAENLEVAIAGGKRQLELASTLFEEDGLTCDAGKAARGERVYPRRVEFVFTAPEREAYADVVADRSKREFDAGLKLGDAEPIFAKVSHRGHGSMLCDRKSFSVNIEAEGGKRPILEGVVEDEFYLLSMCWDQAYVENFTFFHFMRKLDLFPFKFDYVELIIDGENRGVYFMIEKPHEALKTDHAKPVGVVRRNHEQEGDEDEFKLFDETATWLESEYYALIDIAENTPGQEAVNQLRKRMAFDHYLRYVGAMTLLHNSDYGDEVRFLATDRAGNSPNAMFEISAWDPEDMLRMDCVWTQYEFQDPNGLVWCAEGRLEHGILGNDAAYPLYVDQLEKMLAVMTPEEFEDSIQTARSRLLPFLENPETLSAMIEMDEPPWTTYAIAEDEVDDRFSVMRSRFADWRVVITDRIATYRATGGL